MGFTNSFSNGFSNGYAIAPITPQNNGGGAGGDGRRRTPTLVREPPTRRVEFARVGGLPALTFDLGSVAVEIAVTSHADLLHVESAPVTVRPIPVKVVVHETRVLPLGLVFSQVACGSRVLWSMTVEPADDADELFVLGLVE